MLIFNFFGPVYFLPAGCILDDITQNIARVRARRDHYVINCRLDLLHPSMRYAPNVFEAQAIFPERGFFLTCRNRNELSRTRNEESKGNMLAVRKG